MPNGTYPSDLTDREWQLLQDVLPYRSGRGRPHLWHPRLLFDAMFYVLRGGIAWRAMPGDFPPWQTVYFHFRQMRLLGIWEEVNRRLRERYRVSLGRSPEAHAAIIDSQSVKTTENGGLHGFDGHQQVNGRKRHILVDTLGLLQGVVVHSAGLVDRVGGKLLVTAASGPFPALQKIWADPRFSDGTPVTSADVKYSLLRLMLMSTEGGAAGLLLEPLLGSAAPIARTDPIAFGRLDRAIQTPDAGTVVFSLATPFAAFASVLALPAAAVYSKAAAVRAGAWDGSETTWARYNREPIGDSPFLSGTPLGSGPFVLNRYDRAQQVILGRNDRYWRAPARLERVVIRLVTESSTAAQLIRTGDADQIGAGAYSRTAQSQFQALTGVRFVDDLPTLTLLSLFMNFDIKDRGRLGSGTLSEHGIPATFFSDRDVRLGFAHSFDDEGFVRQQLLGKALVNNTASNSSLPGYDPRLRYAFDRAAATDDFKRAWGGRVWQTGFTVSISWRSGDQNRQQAAQMLKANIEALNPKFHVNVQEAQFSQILADAAAGRASVWMGLWQADYGDPHNFAQPLLASDGLTGLRTGYHNAAVDALLKRALTEASASTRAALYREISRLGFDDVAEIPLYQTVAYTAQREWVKGRTYSPLNGGDYYYTTSN